MLKALFGNETCEKILLYLQAYQSGYASAIAGTFSFNLRRVQLQLDRLERGGILVSRVIGNTRTYQFNPKWFFKRELEALLKKALSALSQEERNLYFTARTRPRRKGKGIWPSPSARR
ncbi:MAG TPA: ArsR family transcriptional regulator [Bdellovibrionota bacterium]|nr:ArsR family transcriptional regulator [Bdellovibrionota bacterium]